MSKKKTPHFISTEFKVQREMTAHKNSETLFEKTTMLLQVLTATAIAASMFIFLSKKNKQNKKNKEALAYEVW